jgi:replicative DNA helicase
MSPQIVGEQNRPTSVHAEMTILGAMLVAPESVQDALDLLVAGDFALESHRQIFAAMERLAKLSQPIDIVTITEELMRKKELDSVGGLPYIASLSEGLPRKLSIESYVRIVRDKSRARSLINLAERAAEEASDGQEEAQVVLERAIEDFRELAESQPGVGLQGVGAILDAQGSPESMLERMEAPDGVKTGYGQLDKCTHGFRPKKLIIVAARPSMGKSSWARRAAFHAAVRERKVVAYFPMEEDIETTIRAMLSGEAEVPYDDILSGNLDPHARAKLMEVRERLAEAPLYLDDRRSTVSQVRSKCMKLKRTVGLDEVVIDQLSSMPNDDVYKKGMPKSEWVGEQSKALKRLAKELDVPVIVLNQLKRPEKKGGDIPQLSDLKESGSLEEDADVVVFLHRPEYYDRDNEDLRGVGQMIAAKNREGQTDSFHCVFVGSVMLWHDGPPKDARQAYFDAYQPAYRE